MQVVHDIAYSIGINPGWIGVVLGLVLFFFRRKWFSKS